MKTLPRRAWWREDPAVAQCPIKTCGCPIQRTPRGTLADGMRKHFQFVHPGRTLNGLPPARRAGGAQ